MLGVCPRVLLLQLCAGARWYFNSASVLGDAMMLGPGGVPMVNPAMMQEGAMVFGSDGSGVAADPNFFLLHLLGTSIYTARSRNAGL